MTYCGAKGKFSFLLRIESISGFGYASAATSEAYANIGSLASSNGYFGASSGLSIFAYRASSFSFILIFGFGGAFFGLLSICSDS